MDQPQSTRRAYAIYRKLAAYPMGKWLFTQVICFQAPYFSSIRPLFRVLQPGRATVFMRKRRRVQNHIGTIHALAMGNLCELAAGLVMESSLGTDTRWIPRGMNIEYLAKAHTDQMIRAIESGIPVSVGTVTIGGASTPMTIAGSLIHGLATDFAAMVLGQRVRRGCFCVGSSDIAFMDPISGSLSGIAQTWSAEAAAAQIINSLGFPSLSRLAGVGSGGDFDPDTVSQATATMIEVFYSRPTTVDLLSMVDGGMTYSLRLLLLCHDLIGMLRTLWKGIRIDDETLALELTRSQGPRASYLAQRHTAKHARLEAWRSRYLAAPGETGAAGDGERGLTERIDAHLAVVVTGAAAR